MQCFHQFGLESQLYNVFMSLAWRAYGNNRVYVFTEFLFRVCFLLSHFLKKLEDKIKLNKRKLLSLALMLLATLRRDLNRPTQLFDRFEVMELLETLVRLSKTQAHERLRNMR